MKKIIAWLDKDISFDEAVLKFCIFVISIYAVITLANIVGGFAQIF